MADKVFVDTNILLRAFHANFPEHERVKALFDRLLDDGHELWISRQVVREYLVQTTHPNTFANPLPIAAVKEQLANILSICRVADDTGAVTEILLELLVTHPTRGKQVHDTNIVATLLANEIGMLVTLNVVDFRRFDDRIRLLIP